MAVEEEYIRLIFGLKLKQIRTERNLSLFGLSKLTGLSKSYLNEIEKGKKYPKTDKIVILSEALDVPYDHLVSLKLDKNLAPIGEILQSKILKEIPLEVFGIKESNLIDIIANAPVKVNAFIGTLIKIAQHYSVTRESFFLAALRSYQEAQNNYFEDIESLVEEFGKAYQIDLTKKVETNDLEEILLEEYEYSINTEELELHENLQELRSIFIAKNNTLLIGNHIDESQKRFIYAKEIGYNYMNTTDRLYTFPWIKFDDFDQVLNNFLASYFAGALLIPKNKLIDEVKSFFQNKSWDQDAFISLMNHFTNSPETFYQRLTNILPKQFHFKNLFFLRFTHNVNKSTYTLNKELHITQQQAPRANESNEHYCRKWVSLRTLDMLAKKPKKKHIFDIQISDYPDSNSQYLVFSSATADPFKKNNNRSVSIGILISPHLKKHIHFLDDPSIKTKQVGVTCETCAIKNCKERAAEPYQLIQKERHLKIKNVVDTIMDKLSK
ncbi:MAG: XRE family transcriptional regulator [Flavobacteriaceae bacterium]|nr:XRE family transcriptional regulator [Flavobacteriaceae bacterium]